MKPQMNLSPLEEVRISLYVHFVQLYIQRNTQNFKEDKERMSFSKMPQKEQRNSLSVLCAWSLPINCWVKI